MGAVRRYASAAAHQLGVWVNVITDDASAAQVDTDRLWADTVEATGRLRQAVGLSEA